MYVCVPLSFTFPFDTLTLFLKIISLTLDFLNPRCVTPPFFSLLLLAVGNNGVLLVDFAFMGAFIYFFLSLSR